MIRVSCVPPYAFEASVYRRLGRALCNAPVVDTGHWQAMKDVPQTNTLELQDVVVEVPIPTTGVEPRVQTAALLELQRLINPNLPWAEKHFLERVSGSPLNPPPSAAEWPFAQAGHKDHTENQKFSHTYPERMWPREAWVTENGEHAYGPYCGIRYQAGDLFNMVDLLNKEPMTRQAYLPIWFPEDTGAADGQRVPCTLGYHFMLREGKLDIRYIIRSCDFFRHFRDDVYMAGRLLQWVLATLQLQSPEKWRDVKCGKLTFWAFSFHVFEPEKKRLVREFM